MKKVIILLLAITMVMALVACGTEGNGGTTAPAGTTTTTTTTTATTTTQQTTTTKPVVNVSLEELANALVTTEGLEFSPMVMEVEVGSEWMTGFTSTVTGFSECWQFSPMIGVMPFVGYVFRVADGTDVEAFKTQLKNNSKPNWNICTSANTTICENSGNIVFFAMINIDDDMGLPTGMDTKMIATFNEAVNK